METPRKALLFCLFYLFVEITSTWLFIPLLQSSVFPSDLSRVFQNRDDCSEKSAGFKMEAEHTGVKFSKAIGSQVEVIPTKRQEQQWFYRVCEAAGKFIEIVP